jgi:hypothetical protein
MGLMGANCGSQRTQIHPDLPRRLRNVPSGERLSVRLRQTGLDTGFVPGGQGVAGSNPAVPTGFRSSGSFLERGEMALSHLKGANLTSHGY